MMADQVAEPRKVASCKFCGAAMAHKKATCHACGWSRGLIPVAQTVGQDGRAVTTFTGEVRHRYILTFAIVTVLTGAGLFIGGLGTLFNGDPSGGLLALGGVVIGAAGVATWKITEAGRVWWGLTPGEKLLAIPGIILGAYLIVAIVLGWILAHMFDRN